jgi:hypothetical protein
VKAREVDPGSLVAATLLAIRLATRRAPG